MGGALSGMTTRGRCLLAAGFAAALCAAVLNERDLLRVSVFVVTLPIVVCVLTAKFKVRLAAKRQIVPPRVPVGGHAEVTLHVWSTGRLPTGGLLLQDNVPYTLGGRPRFVIEHLPRHGGMQLRYPVEPGVRGVLQLGPLKAKVTDPFGLAEFDRELAGSSRLVVVPRVFPLFGLPASAGLGAGQDGSIRLRSGQGEDDAVVRPYRQGDDLRKVHWRSTARRDEMMVRVEERPWRGGTTVLLDHRAIAHRGCGPASSLEWAVSFAASVCLHLNRHGYEVKLVAENATMITPEGMPGTSGQNLVLDALAALNPSHQRRLACHTDPGHGQELIAVLGAVNADSVEELVRARPRGSRSLAVLLDTTAWATGDDPPETDVGNAGALLTAAGWGVTVARPEHPMARVWATLCRDSQYRSGTLTGGGWT